MQIFNAVAIARLALRNGDVLGSEIEFGTATWFIYGGLCCFLVLFAGLMSGLTLGLMSISLVDLEILKRSGSSTEQKQAASILPVVQKQHQLLVTLLLCNAGAMEALPIYLDKLFNQYVAIILSVTLVLAFGEVIPQAICTRYGLAVGANFVWLVRILMIVSFPISYPIGKVLDWVLGHNEALFRRAQLKALVSIHGQEAGKGGELTHDETTIINGALDLTEKVRDDVSPGGNVSSTSVESSYSSGHAAEKNSGVGLYWNVTPATRQGRGWSTFGSGSSFNEGNVVEKSNSLALAVEKNSGGVIYRNVTPGTRHAGGWSMPGSASSFSEGNVVKSTPSSIAVEKSNSSAHAVEKNSVGVIHRNVTPANRRGGGRGGGWSNFGSGSSSTGGNVGQSASSSNASSNASGFHRDEQIGLGSGQLNSSNTVTALSKGDRDRSSVNLDRAFMASLAHPPEAAQLSGESMPLKSCSEIKTPESTDSLQEPENSECPIEKFDLCPPRKSSVIKLNVSLLAMNKEKRKEKTRLSSGLQGDILRPGMVLLKNYLSISEQASILKICRDHGLVNVGFYQPQFGEGGKMHLKLMCFGQFWNPETNKYEEVRPTDNSKPPPIPRELLELVDRAVKDSQSLISERDRVKNVESILPSVKPDICLVNYYTQTGRLGLHQDKDESQESLRKGIPIVSFSIGDSAEFLYSDQRDVENADKVLLESGDVLIFGGKSRHIFHGVPAIKPDTAPKMLLNETNFRSGRLNLTFRQRC